MFLAHKTTTNKLSGIPTLLLKMCKESLISKNLNKPKRKKEMHVWLSTGNQLRDSVTRELITLDAPQTMFCRYHLQSIVEVGFHDLIALCLVGHFRAYCTNMRYIDIRALQLQPFPIMHLHSLPSRRSTAPKCRLLFNQTVTLASLDGWMFQQCPNEIKCLWTLHNGTTPLTCL